MTQSISRVVKCIDNGPMEGFCGILKRERHYGKHFTSKNELVEMIENYIRYYNNQRVQRNLSVLTSMEKHRLPLTTQKATDSRSCQSGKFLSFCAATLKQIVFVQEIAPVPIDNVDLGFLGRVDVKLIEDHHVFVFQVV